MSEYKIEYLADVPHVVEACAAWAYGRWGVQKKDGSFARALERFKQGAQKNALPLTIVALTKDGLPAAMASLWETDGDEWPDKTPWIAAVYTLYCHRGKGLAKTLVTCLEQEAVRLGHKEIYLMTGSAAPLYEKLGYDCIDKRSPEESGGEPLLLFVKNI